MGGIEDLAKERARRRPSRLASEDEAAALLAKYSIVTLGSAGRVMYWTRRDLHEGDEALAPEFLSEAAFKLFFRGRFHLTRSRDGDEKRTPLSGYLLDRMQRYAGVVYSPNGPAVSRTGKVNLWRGFGVLPAEGTWSLMRAHLNEVIASGDFESARYILRWLAWCVQHPGERAEVALVVRGKRGMGKGTLGNAMCRVFGAHGVHLSNQKHLTAGFNRHLMHCSFLFADEAFWPGDKSGEGELKRIITEPTLFIEPKGL